MDYSSAGFGGGTPPFLNRLISKLKTLSSFTMHTVYILKCTDDTHYVGCTGNFEGRLVRHNRGEVHYTKSRLPVEVVLSINFPDKYKAYAFEKYLKSGSGRAFMSKRFI